MWLTTNFLKLICYQTGSFVFTVHVKKRLVVLPQSGYSLVAWLILVSEDNSINYLRGSFLVVSSSFHYFRMRKTGGHQKKLVSSTKMNHVTMVTTLHLKQFTVLESVITGLDYWTLM